MQPEERELLMRLNDNLIELAKRFTEHCEQRDLINRQLTEMQRRHERDL